MVVLLVVSMVQFVFCDPSRVVTLGTRRLKQEVLLATPLWVLLRAGKGPEVHWAVRWCCGLAVQLPHPVSRRVSCCPSHSAGDAIAGNQDAVALLECVQCLPSLPGRGATTRWSRDRVAWAARPRRPLAVRPAVMRAELPHLGHPRPGLANCGIWRLRGQRHRRRRAAQVGIPRRR